MERVMVGTLSLALKIHLQMVTWKGRRREVRDKNGRGNSKDSGDSEISNRRDKDEERADKGKPGEGSRTQGGDVGATAGRARGCGLRSGSLVQQWWRMLGAGDKARGRRRQRHRTVTARAVPSTGRGPVGELGGWHRGRADSEVKK